MSIDSYIKKHNFEKFDDTFKVEQAKTIKNPRKNTKMIGNIGKSKVGKKLQLQDLNVLIAKSNKNLLLLPGPVDKTPIKKELNRLKFSSFFIRPRIWAGIIKQIFTLENRTKKHSPISWAANRKAQIMR